jgi:hypothetical protein
MPQARSGTCTRVEAFPKASLRTKTHRFSDRERGRDISPTRRTEVRLTRVRKFFGPRRLFFIVSSSRDVSHRRRTIFTLWFHELPKRTKYIARHIQRYFRVWKGRPSTRDGRNVTTSIVSDKLNPNYLFTSNSEFQRNEILFATWISREN